MGVAATAAASAWPRGHHCASGLGRVPGARRLNGFNKHRPLATSPEVSATHTVQFNDPPPLGLDVASQPTRWQTEEQVSVTATVTNACGPLAGAVVDFAVAWPPQDKPWTGQATPNSGTAVTDANGRASFSFRGDRAGDYRITASTGLATGGQVSDATPCLWRSGTSSARAPSHRVSKAWSPR